MRSRVNIFDLEAGTSTVLVTCDRVLEAPNWHPSGQQIYINTEGRLYSLDCSKPRPELINTGGLAKLNNDHGISPDGRLMAISDKSETGQSCISVLPAGGGVPRRVTMQTPSWWHGWSPDSKTMAYTCVRNDVFGIATIPVAGGDEDLLIWGPHHYDGPDYTPDGEWIWFNSDRGGTMDLWRMRTDGTDVEQMTDEPTVNWFPHPSPDGQHLLYLAYEEGTEGHPPDLPVTLRLMDLATFKTRELIALRGGQGTINVPCWSPDSRRFAYVDYPNPDTQGD